MNNQYVTLDIFNNTTNVMPCAYTFRDAMGLLEKESNKYEVSIHRADYSLQDTALIHFENDISYDLIQKGSTTVIKPCVFKKGFYYSIEEVLAELNREISTDIGTFSYDRASDLLKFVSLNSATLELKISPLLYPLLEGFVWKDYVLKSVNTSFQNFSTTDRFNGRKRVLILADLGQQPMKHLSNIAGVNKSSLLGDQVISSEGRYRLIYYPTIERKISLKSNDKINSFELRVEIEFSSGYRQQLMLKPGSFFNCVLLFSYIDV